VRRSEVEVASWAAVQEFVSCRRLALVGASRSGKKFGNTVLRQLSDKGYEVLPVHPSAESIDDVACWRRLDDIPGAVEGVVVVVPPAEAAKVVHEALEAGITRVWLQQGSESAEAIAQCEERGALVVAGHCILMFAEPVRSVHRVHRVLWRLLGRLPR